MPRTPSIARRSSGSAACPISSSYVWWPRPTATPASSTAIASDATPSQRGSPVTWLAATPARARTTPTTAAVSSNSTVFVVGSRLRRTNSRCGRPASRASARVWRTARASEIPSATSAKPRTAYATPKLSFSAVPAVMRSMPWNAENTAPDTKIVTAAMKAQKKRSLP